MSAGRPTDGAARRFAVGESESGARLDVVLAGWLGESRSQAASRIDRGEVEVDGVPARRSHRLSPGEDVVVRPPPDEPTGAAGTPPPPVRYEDDDLLVVAKPAGLVVHPGTGNTAGTLVQALAEAGHRLAPAGGDVRPGIVHRLDRGTSGLLVVAKTDAAFAGLVESLRARQVERGYLGLVEGRLPYPTGTVDVPIGRSPRDRTRFAALADGKEARTRWQVLAEAEVALEHDAVAVGLVACALETGRTHQIRVHMSYAGCPVAGDRTYGARRDLADHLGLDRPFLHAARLRFRHPVTGAPVEVDEPLPADLEEAARRAGVADAASIP